MKLSWDKLQRIATKIVDDGFGTNQLQDEIESINAKFRKGMSLKELKQDIVKSMRISNRDYKVDTVALILHKFLEEK